jgi:hypothetical protein
VIAGGSRRGTGWPDGSAVHYEIVEGDRLAVRDSFETFERRDNSFGEAVAIGDGLIAIGAPEETPRGERVGSVFLALYEPLWASTPSLSVTTGGEQLLDFIGGPQHRHERYAILGPAPGWAPGIPLPGGLVAPVRRDEYFQALLSGRMSWLHDRMGLLDENGRAHARFILPANAPTTLIGRSLQHLLVTFDPATGNATYVSNAVPVEFTD